MTSLDFEEFLWAKRYDQTFVDNIFQYMVAQKPFSDMELSLLNSLFLDYCVLGGMPAVIRSYVERGTFENSLDIQRQLAKEIKSFKCKNSIRLNIIK